MKVSLDYRSCFLLLSFYMYIRLEVRDFKAQSWSLDTGVGSLRFGVFSRLSLTEAFSFFVQASTSFQRSSCSMETLYFTKLIHLLHMRLMNLHEPPSDADIRRSHRADPPSSPSSQPLPHPPPSSIQPLAPRLHPAPSLHPRHLPNSKR